MERGAAAGRGADVPVHDRAADREHRRRVHVPAVRHVRAAHRASTARTTTRCASTSGTCSRTRSATRGGRGCAWSATPGPRSSRSCSTSQPGVLPPSVLEVAARPDDVHAPAGPVAVMQPGNGTAPAAGGPGAGATGGRSRGEGELVELPDRLRPAGRFATTPMPSTAPLVDTGRAGPGRDPLLNILMHMLTARSSTSRSSIVHQPCRCRYRLRVKRVQVQFTDDEALVLRERARLA